MYGNCMRKWIWNCRPCNPKDVHDEEYIVEQCNSNVLECGGECHWCADLACCCEESNTSNWHCGNLPADKEIREIVCSESGQTPSLLKTRLVYFNTDFELELNYLNEFIFPPKAWL